MSHRIQFSALARAFAVPTGLLIIAGMSLLAHDVVRLALAGAALLSGVAFLLLGTASRWIRIASLMGVLLVLLSPGFRDVV